MPKQTVYSFPVGPSPLGTNHDTYWPGGGAWFNTGGAESIVAAIRRTAQAGTTPTFQVFAEWLFEPTNTFIPLLDFAGAPVALAQQAAAAYDTVPRLLIMGLMLPPGTPTAGKLTFNTTDIAYQIWIPEKLRLRFRHGGTAVGNTFGGQVMIHTRV